MKTFQLFSAVAVCGFTLSGCSGENPESFSQTEAMSQAQAWVEMDFARHVAKFEEHKAAARTGNKSHLGDIPNCNSRTGYWSVEDLSETTGPSFYEHLVAVQCQQDDILYAAYLYDSEFNLPAGTPLSSGTKVGSFVLQAFASPGGSARAYVLSPITPPIPPNPGLPDGACNVPVDDGVGEYLYAGEGFLANCSPVGGVRVEVQ